MGVDGCGSGSGLVGGWVLAKEFIKEVNQIKANHLRNAFWIRITEHHSNILLSLTSLGLP